MYIYTGLVKKGKYNMYTITHIHVGLESHPGYIHNLVMYDNSEYSV